MKNLALSLLIILHSFSSYADNLVTYAAPDFEVTINGQNIFVYNTRPEAFAYFSFEGKEEVTVTFLSPVSSFDIRPKNRNIQGVLVRNRIHFTLDKP